MFFESRADNRSNMHCASWQVQWWQRGRHPPRKWFWIFLSQIGIRTTKTWANPVDVAMLPFISALFPDIITRRAAASAHTQLPSPLIGVIRWLRWHKSGGSLWWVLLWKPNHGLADVRHVKRYFNLYGSMLKHSSACFNIFWAGEVSELRWAVRRASKCLEITFERVNVPQRHPTKALILWCKLGHS